MTTYAPAPPASVETFTEELFAALPRADQRRWARTYMRGLLTAPGKKSLRLIASAVAASPTASQSMHQFINVSPWDWEPVRDELARWISRRLTPEAHVIDFAYIPKRGDHSCGVHTRFVPQLGRSASCQVGLGLFLAGGREALPTHWRLHLPARWLTETERQRARIPSPDCARSLEEQATDLITGAHRNTGGRHLPVIADATTHEDGLHLVRALSRLGRHFAVRVPPHLRLVSADGEVREVRRLTDGTERSVGFTAADSIRHAALSSPVWVPGGASAGGLRRCRILVTDRAGDHSRHWWLTSLTDERIDDVLALTGLLERSTRAVAEMQGRLGLADFEGRSFPGWHHHMTIISAAYAWHRLHHEAQDGPLRMHALVPSPAVRSSRIG